VTAVPFVDPSSLEAHEPRPGWTGRFFHSAQMTFADYAIAAGADVHAHEHPNEEVWHVLEEAGRAIVVDHPVRESVAGVHLDP
jgi:mannose-6-phosphate isomerase-like protein (cupin superfamily)